MLHALLFSLCLVSIFSVLLPIAFSASFSDMAFAFVLSLIPFAILCPNGELGIFLIFVLWALYLGLMTASLCHVRRVPSKMLRVIGHVAIIAAFGTAYGVGWYLTVQGIGNAIAVGLAAAAR